MDAVGLGTVCAVVRAFVVVGSKIDTDDFDLIVLASVVALDMEVCMDLSEDLRGEVWMDVW